MDTMKEVWQGLTDLQRERIRKYVRRHRDPETGQIEVVIEDLPAAWQPIAERIKKFVEGAEVVFLTAPCCGREAAMDSLLDIRSIALATRVNYLTQAGIFNPQTGFLCGGCRGRLFRSGVVKKSQVAQALGAPQALIDKFKSQEPA